MTAQDIIKRPVLTEKAYAGIKNKIYTFEVDKNANKIQIKNAVEELFGVQVDKVNTIRVKGKTKTRNTKGGKVTGQTNDYKKAVVFLNDKSKGIEFFESLS